MMKKMRRWTALVLTAVFVLLACRLEADAKVILPEASGKKVTENTSMVIDYSNIDKGYVMAKYKQSTKMGLRAQVECPNGVKYTYTLSPQKWAAFPLSEGNGSYKVTVLLQLSGTSYSVAGAQQFTAKMKDTLSPFMMSNQYVNYSSGTKCVKKASSLCKGTSNDMKKVEKIYNWTIKYFKYDTNKAKTVQSGYLPNLDQVYKSKKGICFDYAATMTAMLRSQGIPTKLVIGYAGDAYHAWISVYSAKNGWITNAIYFDGKNWNRMDPTFASSSNSSSSVMDYIGDGKNYSQKYAY